MSASTENNIIGDWKEICRYLRHDTDQIDPASNSSSREILQRETHAHWQRELSTLANDAAFQGQQDLFHHVCGAFASGERSADSQEVCREPGMASGTVRARVHSWFDQILEGMRERLRPQFEAPFTPTFKLDMRTLTIDEISRQELGAQGSILPTIGKQKRRRLMLRFLDSIWGLRTGWRLRSRTTALAYAVEQTRLRELVFSAESSRHFSQSPKKGVTAKTGMTDEPLNTKQD